MRVEVFEGALLRRFSMEGNLTAADAYLSGRAAALDDAEAFKTAFAEAVLDKAPADPRIRRYFGVVRMADAASMWRLGQDAARSAADDGFGRAHLRLAALGVANIYLRSRKHAPPQTADFIDRHATANCEFMASGRWKSVDAPLETGEIAGAFFGAAGEVNAYGADDGHDA